MEFKVRALDTEPKSVQEIEKVLLEKHEQELNNETPDNVVEQQEIEIPQEQSVDLREEDVLSYIGKRYNKQINSFDELMAERRESEDLPEDVASYLKYKKETGRGFDDFIKLRKDYESMDSDDLLKDYLLSTQEGLDEEDVDVMMDEYRYDEDLDDESTVKKVKIAKKKVVAEAKKYFNTQKEKYKMPLESSGLSVSQEEKEQYELYKRYLGEAKTAEEENNRKRGWFEQKTNEVFSGEFKGFEFNINDKKMSYTPSDAAELKKLQSNPSNFINKFLDENGLIKDAAGYHRSLAVAMNPEKFAKHFYEQGLADATEDVMRKTKNINMSERRAPEVTKSNDGFQVRAVNPDSGRKLQIRSAKKL
tara:strand:- start:85 stop:1173 length:1089 start_codon:yes stop_codon:yes gene_type:complete